VSIHMWNEPAAPLVDDAPEPEEAMEVDEELELPVIQQELDAWTLLDPHDPTHSVHKPYRKGKIHVPRIPEASQATTKTNVVQFLDKIHADESVKPQLPKNPVKSIAWDEFDTVFIAAQRKRQEGRRRVEKQIVPVNPGGAWTVLPPVSHDAWNIDPDEVEEDEEYGGMAQAVNEPMDFDFGAFEPEPWVRLISLTNFETNVQRCPTTIPSSTIQQKRWRGRHKMRCR